jgi:predicted enzyme related to lactoylglutathione lyase
MKVSECRLLVEKFDECFAFYSQGLGLEVTWGKPGDVYASFKAGEGLMVSIFAAKLMEEHLGKANDARQRSYDPSMLVFEVNDVDQVYAELATKDIVPLKAPHDMPGWGIRCMHLRDPEGNLLEINTLLPKDKWASELQEQDPS